MHRLWQVEGLQAQMCTALSKQLNHENACLVFAAADLHQCEMLKREAFSKIVQHFALAARSDGWLALTKDQLSEVGAVLLRPDGWCCVGDYQGPAAYCTGVGTRVLS